MSTYVITKSRQAVLAMPSSTDAHAAWLRGAVEFQGEVSVFGGRIAGDVRLTTADVPTVPGLPAWSPPI
jgi:hypothetical protein